MTPGPHTVVFSQLDSTLFESAQQCADANRAALAPLAERQIPLIFCSSRTRAEIEHVQQQLSVRHPFICENGGGVFVPSGYFHRDIPNSREIAGYQAVEFGRPYTYVVDHLHAIASRLSIGVVGFSDMSVEEVARECGLPLMAARLAKLREYDEPFRLLDPGPAPRTRLLKALRAWNIQCCGGGGRFDHAGTAGDLALGVQLLSSLYRREQPATTTIGLGDAVNGVSFLSCVDQPIVVAQELTALPQLLSRVPRARVTRAQGASGWAEAIAQIATSIDSQGALQ